MTSKTRIASRWKLVLRRSCDGAGLSQMSDVPMASSWVVDGTDLLSGSDYLSCIHVRTNVPYCKSRVSRGRPCIGNLCSRGCQSPETLDHILQKCWSSHALRIRRHDNLCNYIARNLDNKGYSCHLEERHTLPSGQVLKPDITAYSENDILIIDAQVINDQFPLQEAHENKIKKYEPLKQQLTPLRPDGVKLTSLTLNWRGSISKDSLEDLVD